MTRRSTRGSVLIVLSNLGWPLLWGSATSVLFYALVLRGPLNSDFTLRYFAGHPVSYASTFLFLVGLASLLRLAMGVATQFATLGRIKLEAPPPRGNAVGACDLLIEQLESLPEQMQHSYLGRRLHDALEIVQRKRSAHNLDEELKFLADADSGHQQDGYSLARITIWAIPMLGFLGTVLGLTQCLQGFDAKAIATDMSAAMQGQLGGLYIKFATSAQSLSMSIALMFVQFLVERFETQLLAVVGVRANEELVGRFADPVVASQNPQLDSVQQMTDAVIRNCETLLQRQTELWQATIEAAHDHWTKQSKMLGQQIQSTIQKTAETTLASQSEHWQQAMAHSAQLVESQQREMLKQSELLLRIVQATGDVSKLEEGLNANLHALAGAKNFEDTVMSLSAAIHLLTTRLGPESTARVHLNRAA